MITKEQFLASMIHEMNVIKHLFTKIPESAFDYKPTPGQRTTLEVLQYVTLIAGTAIEMLSGKADAFTDFDARKAAVTRENFMETIKAEEKKITELFGKFTDEMLAEEITNWGQTAPRAIHLFGALKFLVGYKMQIFLYIKANGVENIGTPNLWGGVDPS